MPGDSPEDIGAVTMDVFTTNATGYNVTVEAAAPALVGTATPANIIPVGDISVRETGTTPYTALSNTTAVTVHTQTTPSAATPGDVLSNDYDFTTPIPSVPSDTYTVTLNYIATTNP